MMMDCFDIHTHSLSACFPQSIVSLDVMSLPMDERIVHASVGIHPWFLTEDDADIRLQALQEAMKDSRILALGEAGLDKLKGPAFGIQTRVFREEIALSEKHRLPMVIHCVKAFNELIRLKKELMPGQPWIVHGFRGKASVAIELLRHGCWLSYGVLYQEEALKVTPVSRLFIETDESGEPIESIYRRIAASLGVSTEVLAEVLKKNVQEVFFKG